jgi:hypothetical protein
VSDPRPRFAEGFPRDPDLDALVQSFARGDFGSVRREAARVIEGGTSPEVRAAASELLSRTEPDPLSRVFFLLTAGLLAFLSVYWWWHAHP